MHCNYPPSKICLKINMLHLYSCVWIVSHLIISVLNLVEDVKINYMSLCNFNPCEHKDVSGPYTQVSSSKSESDCMICNEQCYDSDFPNTLQISLSVIHMHLRFHIWRYVHLSCQDWDLKSMWTVTFKMTIHSVIQCAFTSLINKSINKYLSLFKKLN